MRHLRSRTSTRTSTIVTRCTLLLAAAAHYAAMAVAQKNVSTLFYPPGFSDMLPLNVGRGPDPRETVLHLAQQDVRTSPTCSGTNDILTVTFAAPIAGDVAPEDFRVQVCLLPDQQEELRLQRENPEAFSPSVDPDCEHTTPDCVAFPSGDEPNERRTVQLFGSFAKAAGAAAGQHLSVGVGGVRVNVLTALVDGAQVKAYADFANVTGFGWCEFYLLQLSSTHACSHDCIDRLQLLYAVYVSLVRREVATHFPWILCL